MSTTVDTPATPTDAERAAAARLLPLLWGTHISRAVYAMAELGLADELAAGPVGVDELARATRTHAASLYRVLRLLAAVEVLEERPGRSFALTTLGERLRSDIPAGLRSWATFLDALGGLRPFEHIVETVRTGTPGFDLEFGRPIFDYLPEHPDKLATFDAAMSERTEAFAASVAEGCDFSEVRTVVDVGGGRGTLLVAILRRHPHLRGVLLETPRVAARAEAVLDAAELSDRCQVRAGDFFTEVPVGADCYVMANVLHDWDDERAVAILRNCRRVMSSQGRVLIVERLITESPAETLPTLLSDINMLILTGGRERTNVEYGELLAAAGLRIGAVRPIGFPYGVIDGCSGAR